jgi:hypothetical protein
MRDDEDERRAKPDLRLVCGTTIVCWYNLLLELDITTVGKEEAVGGNDVTWLDCKDCGVGVDSVVAVAVPVFKAVKPSPVRASGDAAVVVRGSADGTTAVVVTAVPASAVVVLPAV